MYAVKGELRVRKAQFGIPKNYVIIKIEPIRARFREFPDVNAVLSFTFIQGYTGQRSVNDKF